MRKVLVPTDFSACANNAVAFAVQSAKAIPLEITLLHSFELMGSVYTDYMGINKEFNQMQLDEISKRLYDQGAAIEKELGQPVKIKVITEALGKAILQATEENKFDLIIMGTVGAGESRNRFWSTKTGAEIGKAETPILVIPQEYQWQKPANILFATNHFEHDEAILDPIFELAGIFGAKVQVAIFTDEDDDSPYTFLDHAHTTPNYEKALKKLHPESSVSTVQLFGLEFSETLQRYIDENRIDLLVMVNYHKTLWDRFFHPSMTRQMSYHTKIPLLALPSQQEEWRQ
ncbi:universal stress protein [Flavihumibacter profundi]|uniref:universal stress protein n=1 Tax=Flavihumibacter profundi TaxID=2716883 RepID=UPI001CC35FBB|nr:universal stress protein [Flavihumibacter profundi]MBZ5857625.1 universal stress protein [Flavihumibacter profundi]